MCNSSEKKVDIDEKLATLRFICDNQSHIEVNLEKCKICKKKPCLYFCPAGVYNEDGGLDMLNISYENCLECGTCRICCPYDAIIWKYPRGAHGVRFRFG